MEGTYPLPEAQLDRFFFKLHVPFPEPRGAARDPRPHDRRRARRASQPVLDRERILEMRELVREVPVARHVQDYAVRVLQATHPDARRRARRWRSGSCATAPRRAARRRCSSPRRSARCSRAASPRRSTTSAHVALPALRHRVLLNFEGEAEGMKTDEVIERDPEGTCPRPKAGSASMGAARRLQEGAFSTALASQARRPRAAATTSSSTTSSSASSSTCAWSSRVFAGRDARRAPHQEERLAASSSPITATTSPATTSATSTGTSTGASTGCCCASTKRKRTSRSTSSSTRPRRWASATARSSATRSASRAALAYVGLANLDRVTHRRRPPTRSSERMPPTRGKARIFKVFDFLQGLEADGHDRPRRRDEDVRRAEQAARPRVVLISDLYDPARLRAGHQRAPLQQVRAVRAPRRRPSEAQAQADGRRALYDCETGDEREVTVTAKVLEQLRRGYEEYLDEIETLLHRAAGAATSAPTSTCPSTSSILRVFRRGGFLALGARMHFAGLPLRPLLPSIGAVAGAAIVGALHPQAAAAAGAGAVLARSGSASCATRRRRASSRS